MRPPSCHSNFTSEKQLRKNAENPVKRVGKNHIANENNPENKTTPELIRTAFLIRQFRRYILTYFFI